MEVAFSMAADTPGVQEQNRLEVRCRGTVENRRVYLNVLQSTQHHTPGMHHSISCMEKEHSTAPHSNMSAKEYYDSFKTNPLAPNPQDPDTPPVLWAGPGYPDGRRDRSAYPFQLYYPPRLLFNRNDIIQEITPEKRDLRCHKDPSTHLNTSPHKASLKVNICSRPSAPNALSLSLAFPQNINGITIIATIHGIAQIRDQIPAPCHGNDLGTYHERDRETIRDRGATRGRGIYRETTHATGRGHTRRRRDQLRIHSSVLLAGARSGI
ncbi:hypothetical protein BGZ57DRAFT_120403 [Hyaloscypha finlandica]|nr:hypothetical protein BGZ57DRAFT_120403 [Hyaloscypha finlandica]